MASNHPEGGPGLPPTGGPGYPPSGGPGAPPPGGPIIPAGMVERIKNILLTPKIEWPRIDAEPMTAQGVFMSWAVPLAAIGPVAGFIGQQLFGINALVISFKPSIGYSLMAAVLGYVAQLIGVWAVALIVEALAPTFGGVKNRDQAMKVTAFSYTAAWVAGIVQIIPMLGILVLLAMIYGFYLFWLGLPRLMRAPADKAGGYVAATIVAAIVVYFVLGAIVGTLTTRVILSGGPIITAGRDVGPITVAAGHAPAWRVS